MDLDLAALPGDLPSMDAQPELAGKAEWDGYLAPEATDYSLYSISSRTSKKNVNRKIMYKNALKSIVCDDSKPTKTDFTDLQTSALNDLETIAGWVKEMPGVTLSDRILSVVDPGMMGDSTCFNTTGPGGLPPAKCAKRNFIQGDDSYFYVKEGTGNNSHWVRAVDPDTDEPYRAQS